MAALASEPTATAAAAATDEVAVLSAKLDAAKARLTATLATLEAEENEIASITQALADAGADGSRVQALSTMVQASHVKVKGRETALEAA